MRLQQPYELHVLPRIWLWPLNKEAGLPICGDSG